MLVTKQMRVFRGFFISKLSFTLTPQLPNSGIPKFLWRFFLFLCTPLHSPPQKTFIKILDFRSCGVEELRSCGVKGVRTSIYWTYWRRPSQWEAHEHLKCSINCTPEIILVRITVAKQLIPFPLNNNQIRHTWNWQ